MAKRTETQEQTLSILKSNGAGHQRLAPFYNYHINVLTFWEDDSSQKAFPIIT